MKATLFASALALATTAVASGPPGYGQPETSKPNWNQGLPQGAGRQPGQGNTVADAAPGSRPQNGQQPGYHPQGNSMASPVGGSGHPNGRLSRYNNNINQGSRGPNGVGGSRGPSDRRPKGGNAHGGSMASPMNKPRYHKNRQPQNQAAAPGGSAASPIGGPGNYPPSYGSGKGSGMASPVGQGQEHPYNGQSGPGVASPVGQGQEQPQNGQGGSEVSPVGGSRDRPSYNGADKRPDDASPVGQGQEQPQNGQGGSEVSPVEGSRAQPPYNGADKSPGEDQTQDLPHKRPDGTIVSPTGGASGRQPPSYGFGKGSDMASPIGQNKGHPYNGVSNDKSDSKPSLATDSQPKDQSSPNSTAVSPIGGLEDSHPEADQCCTATSGDRTSAPQVDGQYRRCLKPEEASAWIEKFIGVFAQTSENPASDADQIIADRFVFLSNSIQSLKGLPIAQSPIASTKQEWIQERIHVSPPNSIKTLDLVVGCDKIVWFWSMGVGSETCPTQGFNLFHMVRDGRNWQTDKLNIEFDSVAWGVNTGAISNVVYANGTSSGAETEA